MVLFYWMAVICPVLQTIRRRNPRQAQLRPLEQLNQRILLASRGWVLRLRARSFYSVCLDEAELLAWDPSPASLVLVEWDRARLYLLPELNSVKYCVALSFLTRGGCFIFKRFNMLIDMRDISRLDLVSDNVFVKGFVISKLQGRLFSRVFGCSFSLEQF